MNKLLEKKIIPGHIEYFTCTENLCVLEMSSRVQQIANPSSNFSRGSNICQGFPELTGCENSLLDVFYEREESFELKGIDRSSNLQSPFYIDLYAVAGWEESTQQNCLTFFVEDVTERVLLEQKLVEQTNQSNLLVHSLEVSKAYIEKILTSMAEVVIVTSATNHIKTVNQSAQQLLGYTEAELLGQPLSLIVPNTKALALFQHTEMAQSDRPLTVTTSCQTKTGAKTCVEFSCALLPTGFEEGPDFIYVGRDITERNLVDQKLLQQNQRVQLLAEITLKIRESLHLKEILQATVTEVQQILKVDRALIFRLQPNGSGEVVTEAVAIGWPAILDSGVTDDCLGPEYFHKYQYGHVYALNDIDQEGVPSCLAEFLRQVGVRAKLVVPILQGNQLWGLLILHQCASTRQWSAFEIELLQQLADQVGIALAQAQLLEAVQESEKQFRQLTENINEVFWMTTLNPRQVIYISPAYEKVWGRSCESLYKYPRSWTDMIHPEDRDLVQAQLRHKDQGDIVPSQEYRIVRPDGVVRWIWAREFPIYNEAGEIYRIAGIGEDITDRKQAEAETLRVLNRERELSELRSRFISMASHEFRTPLSTILLSAELLENYGDRWDNAEKKESYQRIQGAVHNMTQLLNDVLTIGKAEAGKLEVSRTHLNVISFCKEIIYEMQLSDANQHSIVFEQQGNYQTAYLDEKLLRQILTNLISNAIKYSPEHSKIRIFCICQEDSLSLKIQDQGIGIPLKDQELLFSSFYRASNVGEIAGTGLGLSIVKRCVDLHNGHIHVESTLGEGTSFTVVLPTKNQGDNDDVHEQSVKSYQDIASG